MKLKELVNRLEELDVKIGNYKSWKFYKDNKEKEVKVRIYARVSKKDNSAITKQLDNLRFFTQDLELPEEVISEYYDNGVYGTASDKREGYSEMLRSLKSKYINCIITTHIDRLGRLTNDNRNLLYNNGETNLLYIDMDNRLVNSMDAYTEIHDISNVAQDYVKASSVKTKRGLNGAARKGSYIGSKAPFGLERYRNPSGIVELRV